MGNQQVMETLHPMTFAVNDEPYCLWDADIKSKVESFLNGIDVDYFDYTLQTNLNTDDENRAIVAIRLSLHHSIETLFSLLGAYVQAPRCPFAWIAKCSNKGLRQFTRRIRDSDETLARRLNLDSVSWHSISKQVFLTYKPSHDTQEKVIENYAKLWEKLTEEFNNQDYIDEYNALKHGFRARQGGFHLQMGINDENENSPDHSDMMTLGQSEFGATFIKVESATPDKTTCHITSAQTSINWTVEKTVVLHQLVHGSINNVISALKIINNYPPSTCKFIVPTEESSFSIPWEKDTGVMSFTIRHPVNQEDLPKIDKNELLTRLRKLSKSEL